MNNEQNLNNPQSQQLNIAGVSGSASSEPNPIAQPQMWVDWYKIVYGGNEQDAKKVWGRKMFMLGY